MSCFITWILLLHLVEFSRSYLRSPCPDVPMSDTGCTINCAMRMYKNFNLSMHEISSCPMTVLGLESNRITRDKIYDHFKFVNSGLTTIKNNAFHRLTIMLLTFANSFTTVEPRAFSEIYLLYELHFVNNPNLTRFPEGVFKNLTELSTMSFVYNGLTMIHKDTFRNKRDLRNVYLYGNAFHCIPYDLFSQIRTQYKLEIVMSNPTSDDEKNRLIKLKEYGVELTPNVNYSGICSQSFIGLNATTILYDFDVDECVIKCNVKVTGLNSSSTNISCDCSSMEGCESCYAVNVETTTAVNVDTTTAPNVDTTPAVTTEIANIAETSPLPSRASQTILPGNLCLTIGVLLGVIGLVLLF